MPSNFQFTNTLFVPRSTRTFHYHKSIIVSLLDRRHTVRAPEEFPPAILRILNGYDFKKENRRRFIESFIRPNGMSVAAGEIAAQKIEELLRKKL